jgi:hypothetical protein
MPSGSAAYSRRLLRTTSTVATPSSSSRFRTVIDDGFRSPHPYPPPQAGEGIPFRLPTAADIPMDTTELERSGLFEAAIFRRYEWEQSYSAQEYIDVLSTYSGHRGLEEARRRQLFFCIERIIVERYSGRIRKRYLNELRIARRRAFS